MTDKLRTGIAHIDIVKAVNDLVDRVDALEDFHYAVEEKPIAKKAPAKKVAPPAE